MEHITKLIRDQAEANVKADAVKKVEALIQNPIYKILVEKQEIKDFTNEQLVGLYYRDQIANEIEEAEQDFYNRVMSLPVNTKKKPVPEDEDDDEDAPPLKRRGYGK